MSVLVSLLSRIILGYMPEGFLLIIGSNDDLSLSLYPHESHILEKEINASNYSELE